MSKSGTQIIYRQCWLVRGPTHRTVWIPEKYAKKGKFIKIKDEDGWQVRSVGTRMAEDQLLVVSQSYKHTREVSDV